MRFDVSTVRIPDAIAEFKNSMSFILDSAPYPP
jgi:hypothetical protein